MYSLIFSGPMPAKKGGGKPSTAPMSSMYPMVLRTPLSPAPALVPTSCENGRHSARIYKADSRRSPGPMSLAFKLCVPSGASLGNKFKPANTDLYSGSIRRFSGDFLFCQIQNQRDLVPRPRSSKSFHGVQYWRFGGGEFVLRSRESL